MVANQIINKILKTKSLAIYEDNLLTPEHFVGYEDKINFIINHKETYGNVPDTETFLAHFTDAKGNCSFDIVDVSESDKYLVDTIKEEYLYYQTVPVLQKAADLMKQDSNAAAEYLNSQLSVLQPSYKLGGVDIISSARERLEEFKERKSNPKKWYFESGFKELDEITRGIQRGEELVVIGARTNQGKSWILEKMCSHVWKTGYNVGYISPEMTALNIGFRFDSLFSHFSNRGLMWGKEDVDEEEYTKYLESLMEKENKFLVATPADFGRNITVSKLRSWVKQNKLDMIAVDGITYLRDEHGHKNDNLTTTLTNISADLMDLSVEMGIPILVVVQLNRNGVEDTGLESVRDSDGICFSASKVILIRQLQDNMLEMKVAKQRTGKVGDKLNYRWTIDTSDFEYLPGMTDSYQHNKEAIKEVKKKFSDKEDVF